MAGAGGNYRQRGTSPQVFEPEIDPRMERGGPHPEQAAMDAMGQYPNTANDAEGTEFEYEEEAEGTPEASQFIDMIAAMGRGGDNRIAHVHSGEILLPRQLIDQQPQLLGAIMKAFAKVGKDWREFMVDGPTGADDKVNPSTGLPEYQYGEGPDIGSTDRDIAGAPGFGGAGFDAGYGAGYGMGPDSTDVAGQEAIGISQEAANAPANAPRESTYDPDRGVVSYSSGMPDQRTDTQSLIGRLDRELAAPPGTGRVLSFGERMLGSIIPSGRSPGILPGPPGAALLGRISSQFDGEGSYPGGPQEGGGVTAGAGSGGLESGIPAETGQGPIAPPPYGPEPAAAAPAPPPAPSAPSAPSYSRPPELQPPSFLGLDPNLTELQRRAIMATYGLNADESIWRDPLALEFYKNLIQRMLIGDNGMLNPMPNLLPVERQYLSQVVGAPEFRDVAGLLEGIGIAPPGQRRQSMPAGGGGSDSAFWQSLGYTPESLLQLENIAAS